MDDLYNNAWGDTSDFYTNGSQNHASSSQSAWISPTVASPPQHEEADLATPSWSTGADIKWNEPSEHEQTHGFAWSTTEPDLAWSASTYEDIALGKPEAIPSTEEPSSIAEDEPVDEDDIDVESNVPEPLITSSPAPDLRLSSPIPSEVESPPASPEQDGFGTFEDAATFEDTAFPAQVSAGLEEDTWGSPWAGAPAVAGEDEDKPVDEWELARKNKERLDRLVPPQVLADIISQCEEYFNQNGPQPSATDNPSTKEKIKEEPWMKDWRSGIDGIEGLENLMQSLVPELTLQPAPQFTKTGIAKNMASTVRVTKNLPLSKASPISYYMAARGSTAWETAIKQSKVVIEEDVVPIGWRIVEKQLQPEAESPTGTKASGGFFSFWSKRQSKTPTPIRATSKEPSPSRASTSSIPSGDVGSQSPRVSVDNSQTRSMSIDKNREPSPTPISIPAHEEPTRAPSVDLLSTPSPTPSSFSYADAPESQVDGQTQVPQPPPTAVSRFLTRFSRRRSSLGGSSPISSLALSSDDLEFLSDIVPSANDGNDEDMDSLKSLNNILKPEPLPPALPPPPLLVPPPRPASIASPPNQLVDTIVSSSSSLIDTLGAFELPAKANTAQSDLEDVFGAFETSPPSSGIASPTASVPEAGYTARVHARSPTPVISAPHTRTSSPSPLSFSSTLVPTRSESQPSVLPHTTSHLTPAVTVTAAVASLPAQRSATEPSSESMSRRQQLRPKIPLSFTLPPPPAPISPGLPSASEIPLAQLYPEAAARQHAQHASTSSISGVSIPRPASSFTPPPSQPSRSHTPIMIKAPLNSGTVAPLLAPPPGSSRPAAALTTNLLAGDDDDDFDDFTDFQSSTPATAITSAPQKSGFSFLPPPPSATTKPPSLKPLLPPPSFSSPLLSSPSTPQPLSTESLADDFGAMLMPSSMSLDSRRSRPSELNISFQSDQSLLTPSKKLSGFDNFSSSANHGLRTPSPPRPISKPARPSLSLEPPKVLHPPPILSPEEKEARATQHQRTLSLMERAAARPGQWPAPPSPLPQALSFPILGTPAPKQNVDLLGDDESFGTFQSDSIQPSSSAPSVPSGASSERMSVLSQPAHTWGSFAPVVPPAQAAVPTVNGAGASAKGDGVLSAQDLSFFEGL